MITEEIILSEDEVKIITSGPAGTNFVKCIEALLASSRLEVDTIDTTGLPKLQGRISAIKSILSLLGVDYE